MIISEKQILQFINICKDYSVILSLSSLESASTQYNRISELLDMIANQQSEELKMVE